MVRESVTSDFGLFAYINTVGLGGSYPFCRSNVKWNYLWNSILYFLQETESVKFFITIGTKLFKSIFKFFPNRIKRE